MLTLYLLRHAKSSWADEGQPDFDRPLNLRGRRDAPLIGRFMAANDMQPELVLCSAARRTRETLALMLPYFDRDITILMERALYELGSGLALEDRLRSLPAGVARVLVVGHNPVLEELALNLVGPQSDDDAAREMALKYPTGGLAHFRLDCPAFTDTAARCGQLISFTVPKSLLQE